MLVLLKQMMFMQNYRCSGTEGGSNNQCDATVCACVEWKELQWQLTEMKVTPACDADLVRLKQMMFLQMQWQRRRQQQTQPSVVLQCVGWEELQWQLRWK